MKLWSRWRIVNVAGVVVIVGAINFAVRLLQAVEAVSNDTNMRGFASWIANEVEEFEASEDRFPASLDELMCWRGNFVKFQQYYSDALKRAKVSFQTNGGGCDVLIESQKGNLTVFSKKISIPTSNPVHPK